MLKYRKGIFKVEQVKSFSRYVWIIRIYHEKSPGAVQVTSHFASEQEALDYVSDHTNLTQVSVTWFNQCEHNLSKRPK